MRVLRNSLLPLLIGCMLGTIVTLTFVTYNSNLSCMHSTRSDKNVKDTFNWYKSVRVLCWVMTSPDNLFQKAIHINATWGKRCDILLFVSDSYNSTFPTINITVETGRDHLIDKTRAAFDYVYKYHLLDADWFLKADDDTYVIVENLRHFLSSENPNEAVFYGNHFHTGTPIGFMSGGAGYVLSAKALFLYGEKSSKLCQNFDVDGEDVWLAECMRKLGVVPGDSRDSLGRSRFHSLDANDVIHGHYPKWMEMYQKQSTSKGMENISDYPISFHYISPEMLYTYDYFAYKMKTYAPHQILKHM